jgi:tetratricopeptide (TPR) repeat protein
LFAVFCVFLPTAGFVQADRLYSALFFVSWLLLCGLLRKPSVRLAIIAGMTCGVCFLAKASIVYMLACFAVIALVAKLRRRSPSTIDSQKRGRSFLRAAVITTLVFAGFFAVSFPYLLTSKQRFGNWFYNVNTTYYFWCDSWREAKAFGDRYKTEEGAPNAPVEATPGPLRYWRTHTMAQIARRIWAGGTSLAAQVTHDRSTWFMIAMALIALFLLMKRPALPFVLRTEQAPILFTILVLVGYSVACAWYAQIAYGNRFISSLYLPVMGGLFWLIHRSDQLVRNPQLPNAPPTVEIAALYLSGGIIMHGLYFARYATHAPDRPFIQFYYDESRERELEGDLEEAGRGYQGVLQLDGGFAPAMHGLGMIALVNGQYPEALRVLARAVDYDPNSADLRNSLGSALFQSGRTVEAVEQFQKAIELDPRLPGTWLNLGGALAQSGDFEGAWAARSNLEKLDPSLARRLDQVIRSFEQK